MPLISIICTFLDGNIEKKEVDYVRLLNKMLPPDIRVLAWVPIDHDFDAR